MQKILDGTNPGPPIGQTMGYALHEVSEGRAVFRGTPEFNVTNPLGTVHGGWYGTLLDSAMACAVQTKVPRGSIYTTLEYKINILRGIPLGTQIECIGTAWRDHDPIDRQGSCRRDTRHHVGRLQHRTADSLP